MFIDFGRSPKWNCPVPEPDITRITTTAAPIPATRDKKVPGVSNQLTSELRPVQIATALPTTTSSTTTTTAKPTQAIFKIPPIKCNEPEDRVFYAQIGI